MHHGGAGGLAVVENRARLSSDLGDYPLTLETGHRERTLRAKPGEARREPSEVSDS